MIVQLAQVITSSLCKEAVIGQHEEEVYQYGFEIIISSVIGVSVALSLGILLNELISVIIFLVIFSSTRLYCGGFHADTYLKCNFFFTLICLTVILSAKILSGHLPFYVEILFLLSYGAAVLEYSPVVHENKTLTSEERSRCRYISIWLSVLWVGLAVILHFVSNQISTTISITLLFITALMVIEKIIKQEVLT